MIGLGIVVYVIAAIAVASMLGRRLRRQSPLGRLPEIQAVRDQQLDITPATKRGGVR